MPATLKDILRAFPIILIFLFIIPFSGKISAEERILDFQSRIVVHQDASLTVTETIRVRAGGEKIKRGIYRDFPTRYRDRLGMERVVGFEVLEVFRDGMPEPHHFSSHGNSVRVYMGKENVFLKDGEYTYTLVYRTDRQLGFFGEYDELYWNVTGNGWEFPIDQASALVELPDDAGRQILAMTAYTGPQGARGRDFATERDPASGLASFRTTKSLGEREGLTIALSWPKGYLREPSSEEKLRDLYADNRGSLWGLAGILLVVAYYLGVWSKVGRDPEPGVVVVRYGPPDGMSPAVMRFIREMGYDGKCLAAAIISLAVKGHVTVKEDGNGYSVKKKDSGKEPPSREECHIMDRLLGAGGVKTHEAQDGRRIRDAVKVLREDLKSRFERIYFVTNRRYFITGLLISAGVVAASGFQQAVARGTLPLFLFISLWLTGWTFGVTMLLWRAAGNWRRVFRGDGGIAAVASSILGTVFVLPFLVGEAFGIYVLGSQAASYMIAVFLILAALLNVVFYHLLKAPTRAGRRILDEIEGFRTFLSATEKDRLNYMNPPERTPALFERYLPHALALDVEQRWAEQFSSVLATAAEGGREYTPTWYAGRSLVYSEPTGFASALGGSFSDALSSASAPGSSSGSGGGGSSGGGGGGGGGGGW